jgi:uncharacterized protein DUF3618
MAETTADVRRDIELTRERMSSTIEELEQKLNVKQMIADHPWPALALAIGAGVLLSGTRADVKAAAATVAATKGASSKLGSALDDVVANLMTTVSGALQGQVDNLLNDVKDMIGAPKSNGASRPAGYGVGPVDIQPEKPLAPVRDIPRAD